MMQNWFLVFLLVIPIDLSLCTSGGFDSDENLDPITIQCEANKMVLTVPREHVLHHGGFLSTIHLLNNSCKAKPSDDGSAFIFVVSGDLSKECGTRMQKNSTHVVYMNEVHSYLRPQQNIITGSTFFIPFQCAMPTTNFVSMSYKAVVESRKISSPAGRGKLPLTMKLFKTDKFQTQETDTTFSTSHVFYVEVELETDEDDLSVVLERCWATPSGDINDDQQYGLIEDSCPLNAAAGGTFKVLSNGMSKKARIQVQAFSFIKQTTTFIHCQTKICQSTSENCVPNCSGKAMDRKKRWSESYPEQRIGPLQRSTPNSTGLIAGLGAAVGLQAVVMMLLVAKLFRASIADVLFRRDSSKNKSIPEVESTLTQI